ncbi:MAG: ABC transporter ATP-binding protein [Firmicutes bacterium]|nr:ABC transporter ATP-binding protein [Candidatus Fermentithermobacillaceae bacterium]
MERILDRGAVRDNPAEEAFLIVEHLRKTFKDRKQVVEAVKDISFSVGKGEMIGLLGPNGAGKTTTIKCVLGLVKADSGRIEVGGVDCLRRPREAARYMAAVLEGARNTYWRLTVWENIVFFAGIHGISKERGKDYFEYLLEVLKLKEKRNVEVRNLSSGFKQKTALACALAKMTPLVFLDEPTLGLDVESSYELREALKNLQANEKRTIVVSSHDMRVIQDVCSRVVIVSRGRVVVDRSIPELIGLFRSRSYKVVLTVNGASGGWSVDDIRRKFESLFPLSSSKATKDTLELSVTLRQPAEVYELVDFLKTTGASIETITQEEVDLERAFLEIVRRENGGCGTQS